VGHRAHCGDGLPAARRADEDALTRLGEAIDPGLLVVPQRHVQVDRQLLAGGQFAVVLDRIPGFVEDALDRGLRALLYPVFGLEIGAWTCSSSSFCRATLPMISGLCASRTVYPSSCHQPELVGAVPLTPDPLLERIRPLAQRLSHRPREVLEGVVGRPQISAGRTT